MTAPARGPGPLRVCAILHDGEISTDTLGLIGEYLADRADLQVVVAGRDPLPDPATLDAVVVMGSARSAHDDTVPWLEEEMAYLRDATARSSVLGVCFGAQVLSRALGGTVAPAAHPEIGWYSVDSDDAAVIHPGPWFQYHSDAFTAPPGSVELARSETGSQAFRIGSTLGVQFHPEMSSAAFASWGITPGSSTDKELTAAGLDLQVLTAEIAAHQAEVRGRTIDLLDQFFAQRAR